MSSQINLHALFSATPTSEPEIIAPMPGPSAADGLRLGLAVRGWTRPRDLIARSGTGESASSVLAAVALEAETAAGLHPGRWFLSVPSRIAALEASDEQALLKACRPLSADDPNDPVLLAFSKALSPAPLALETIDEPTLRALVNVNSWLGPRWRQSVGTAHLNAEIAARTLSADLARMTAQPLVGAVHRQALSDLHEFIVRPRANWLTYKYIYGAGGGGKTTLLAHLQRELCEASPLSAIARIDFDEPAIDPGRIITLNLALFEQLAASAPQIAQRIAGVLPDLRRTASALRASEYADMSPFAAWTMVASSPQQSLIKQRYESESVSDQSSILFRLLAPEMLGGPLVLILDTAELVLSDNDRAAAGLVAWLHFLHSETGAEDIRMIIAGRDPPAGAGSKAPGIAASDLLSRLDEIGAPGEPSCHLPELVPSEAEALLENCGVKDAGLRRAAAEAVPGNPLLLRISADALLNDDTEFAASVHSAHAMVQVDSASARTYLSRRIVAHVADPQARPYVLAAMATPILTRGMLREVVMPTVDAAASLEDAKLPSVSLVRRILQSFGATVWLGRMSLDRTKFAFNRDLRALVQTLVEAVDDDRAQRRALHERLAEYHSARGTSLDRAMTIYHAATLGREYKMPRGARVNAILRSVFDQLPEELQHKLGEPGHTMQASTKTKALEKRPAPEGAEKVGDRDWALYLEGSGTRPGQGEQLVLDDRADDALKLYRDRPTRTPGLPPTFMIQALADLGAWSTNEIDLVALVDELRDAVGKGKKDLSPNVLSRLYWTTRFAMLAEAGRLSEPHLDLLADACKGLRGPSLTTLPALIAVAEATNERRLLTDRLIAGVRGHEAEARIVLARREQAAGTLTAGQMAVTQRDWLGRVSGLPWIDWHSLAWAQQTIDALAGKPIAAVNQAFAEMRRTVPYQWDGSDTRGGILLFRGHTVELLRPLRETLAALYAEQPLEVTDEVLAPISRAMTILPTELEESNFFERLRANPRAWLTGFVGFADRARLLRGLCDRIAHGFLRHGEALENADRVAQAYVAWDTALCMGGSSDWDAA